MRKKDTETKAYMRENKVFADAFNYLIYNGRKEIRPENLKELDTTELVQLVASEKNQKKEAVQKYRDILKSAVIMQDQSATYLVLGIENQSEVHYAMPVRNMIYDALQYGTQVTAIASVNKEKETAKTSAEFLSGFCKKDKLLPVITLVIHFGADPWDGARSLYDMMDLEKEELRAFVQDYKIHLIDPASMKPEELEKFSTSLRGVLGYIKYSQDKEKLLVFMKSNSEMTMEIQAVRVIEAVMKTSIKIPEEEEEVDMCKAIEDLLHDSREEGIQTGIERGTVLTLKKLVQDGILSVQEAARRADMTESAFETEMQKG